MLALFVVLSQVLISMVYLPDVMPASFQATYTPVESAGTDAQIKHLARLMATQMTAAGIGPGWSRNLSKDDWHWSLWGEKEFALKEVFCFSGLEQCKARESDAGREEGNEDDSGSKDQLIKRKFPAVMMGQAISVVGGYTEKAEEAAPAAAKRLPEPILPTAQTKWAVWRGTGNPALLQSSQPLPLHKPVPLQTVWNQREEESVPTVRRHPAFIGEPDRSVDLQSDQPHPALREGHRPERHVPRESTRQRLQKNPFRTAGVSPSIILLKTTSPLKYAPQVRVKLLSRLVTQFDGMMKDDVLKFVLEDIRARSDLAFSLLYQEYNTYLSQLPSGLLDSYDHCLYTLLSGLQEKPEQKDGWEWKPLLTRTFSQSRHGNWATFFLFSVETEQHLVSCSGFFQTFYKTGLGSSCYNRISPGGNTTVLWGWGE